MRGAIKNISEEISTRYDTLEKNIQTASNSFYDAYLDLLEAFLRQVAASFDIGQDRRRSVGDLLRSSELREAFVGTMGLEEKIYSKLGDYVLKINAHKHKKEKTVCVETVKSYLSVFYECVIAFWCYHGVSVPGFDSEYYNKIFNSTEKEQKRLNQRIDGMYCRLRRMESEQKSFTVSDEPYTKTAKKYFRYNGTAEEHASQRSLLKRVGVALILCVVTEAVLAVLALTYWGVLCVAELAWAFLALRILLKVRKAEMEYNATEYADYILEEMYIDKGGLPRKTGKAAGAYILCLCLCVAATFFQILISAYVGGALASVLVPVELVVCAVAIIFYAFARGFFGKYERLHVEGVDKYGNEFSFIYYTGDNRVYTEEKM